MSKVPIHRLKKDEIIRLATTYCKHGHTYLSHYGCYEPPETEKIGFMDIEASNLVADFGIMLSYCIKERGNDEILEGVLTPAQIKKAKAGDEDKVLIESFVKDLMTFDRIVTFYGCLTPEHRILNANLEWVEAGSLQTGDKLVSCSEYGDLPKRRRWVESTVVNNISLKRPCQTLYLSDNTTLTATIDHPFLAAMPGAPGQYTWVKVNKLKKGDILQRLLPTWKAQESYEAGWLAGFFDGEGNLNQSYSTGNYNNGKYAFSLAATQKEGLLVDTALAYLGLLGFSANARPYDREQTHMRVINVLGDVREKMRFLGAIRPKRLLAKFNASKMNSIKNFGDMEVVRIEEIGPVSEQEVAGLETTSKTYISEGFGSHNTGFDFPFARARALVCGVDFPSYGSIKHTDLYYIMRNKFKISSRRLENCCRVLLGETQKTRIKNEYWRGAVRGDKESLAYVLEHNRYDVIDLEKLYEKSIGFSMAKGASI